VSVVSRLLLAAAILVAEFGLIELGLRLEGGSEAAPAFQALFLQDPRVGYRLKPGARTRYTTVEFSTDITINGQGVRDDRDIGPKAPNERRIVILGDSLVLALQVPLEQTFCKLLEVKLNRADPAHQWRVINAGVQGYGAVQEWLLYRHVAEAFQPDIVLVASFVGNAPLVADKQAWIDMDGEPPRDAAAHATTLMRRMVRSSMVLQLVNLRYNQLKAHFEGPVREAPLGTYLANPPPVVQKGLDVAHNAMARIADRAARNGSRMAILLMPARFQTDDPDYERMAVVVEQAGGTLIRNAGTERFRRAYASIGVPMLDLLPTLEAQPDRMGLFFQQNVHFTPRGHEVAAEAIFQFLETSGLAGDVARSPNHQLTNSPNR
jgi:lysophospholipase L1-like esterase